MRGDLTQLIMRLASRECGMHSANPEFENHTTGQVCNAANKLVLRGVLHKAKLAHKEARYYVSAERAAQVERNAEYTRKAGRFGKAATERPTQRADWAGADMVITDKTVFTRCPGHQPRFQAVDTPNVYGGNQRGRVTAYQAWINQLEHAE